MDYVAGIFDDIDELTDEEKDTSSLACGSAMVDDEPLLEESICLPSQACGQKLNLEFDGFREIIGFECMEGGGSDAAIKVVASFAALIAAAYAI